MAIEYAESAVEDDTGRRLKLAEARLDPVSLLLYCDNYWPMDFYGHKAPLFGQGRSSAQITVYGNRDRYTRDNVRIAPDGTVLTYDKDRKAPDLAGVDIGFIFLKRSVVQMLPGGKRFL